MMMIKYGGGGDHHDGGGDHHDGDDMTSGFTRGQVTCVEPVKRRRQRQTGSSQLHHTPVRSHSQTLFNSIIVRLRITSNELFRWHFDNRHPARP